MDILITGGSGFIGSNLVRHLLTATDHCVLNLDKLNYAANPLSFADFAANPRYHFAQTDLAAPAAPAILAEHFAIFQPDWIIHLAAETHVDRSIDDPAAFIESNVCGTAALLEAARIYFAQLKGTDRERFRLLHVSTDEVYGTLSAEDSPLSEGSAYAPRSPYSASKAAADHLAHAWAHTYGLPVMISTSSNNYGPYQFPEKLIPLALIKALRSEPIPLYGNGKHCRDWLHVSDHISALLAILCRGAVGETYHIASGYNLSNLALLHQISRLLDELRSRRDGHAYSEQIRFVADRPGHDFRYALDTSKIRSEINWIPQHTLADGLRQTVSWYLENEAWWPPLFDRRDALQRLGKPQSRLAYA